MRAIYPVIFLFMVIRYANCGCILNLNTNFGSPYPVIVQNGGLVTPNIQNGDVRVERLEALTVACPGNNKYVVLGNDTTDFDVVEAKCISNTTFHVGRWTGEFKKITCSGLPWFSNKKTKKCHNGNQVIEFGYEIEDQFYKLYEVCFDNAQFTTLYSIHVLSPANYYTQLHAGQQRPQFIDQSKIFGKVRVSNLYKIKHQKDRLNQLLGDGMAKKYVTAKQFLTRGHLSPRADFSMYFAQRASFDFANSAPQWMRGNAGDWAALEEGLRRRIKTYGSDLTIYTGTYGVLTLADSQGQQQTVYLQVDENNNGVLPVPLYYFKLVYDHNNKTAAAFVSINSPYYDKATTEELIFCNDICEEDPRYKWLTWRSNDGTTSFCCNYEELRTEIEFLPKLDVRGQFY